MRVFHFFIHAFILLIAVLLFPFVLLITLVWWREEGVVDTIAYVYKEYASACVDFPPPD